MARKSRSKKDIQDAIKEKSKQKLRRERRRKRAGGGKFEK
jgi:hypothetical protein